MPKKKPEPAEELTQEEIAEIEKNVDAEEVTEAQIEEAKKKLFQAVARNVSQTHEVIVSRERLTMLQNMELAAQNMAESVVAFFKHKDMNARKRLILKAVEILEALPNQSYWNNNALDESRDLRSTSESIDS